jgi:hypothetical protein
MATRHGNKAYLQVLLDPNRADLMVALAEKADMRPSAWVREAVYRVIKEEVSEDEYADALEGDEEAWRDSVRRRVEGRMRSRQDAIDSKISLDATGSAN